MSRSLKTRTIQFHKINLFFRKTDMFTTIYFCFQQWSVVLIGPLIVCGTILNLTTRYVQHTRAANIFVTPADQKQQAHRFSYKDKG